MFAPNSPPGTKQTKGEVYDWTIVPRITLQTLLGLALIVGIAGISMFQLLPRTYVIDES